MTREILAAGKPAFSFFAMLIVCFDIFLEEIDGCREMCHVSSFVLSVTPIE